MRTRIQSESPESEQPMERRFEVPPPRPFASVSVRVEDKVMFDRVQGWLSLQEGRNVRQWDVFSVVLAAALENPEFEAAREVDRKRLSSRGRMRDG